MKKYIYKITTLISSTMLFYFLGCSEDITPTLTEFSAASLPTPVITAVNPPTEALAGVTKITITGSNFSSTVKNNLVYFNGVSGKVISSTPTQLELTSPVVISDSVLIKIAIIGSEKFSNVLSYKLKAASAEFYPFNPKIFEVPYGKATARRAAIGQADPELPDSVGAFDDVGGSCVTGRGSRKLRIVDPRAVDEPRESPARQEADGSPAVRLFELRELHL